MAWRLCTMGVSFPRGRKWRTSMSDAAEMRTAPGTIPGVVAALRRTFESGRTRPRAWREAQLGRLDAMLAEKADELHAALEADLGKSSFEGWMAETGFLRKEIAHARAK